MKRLFLLWFLACAPPAPTSATTAPARSVAPRGSTTTSTTSPAVAPPPQGTAPAVAPVPTACAPQEKLFRCHALAVAAHLGIDRPAEPAAARTLYADACSKGYAASCNNLAVLATLRSELATGVDPETLWATACKKLDGAACDNARRARQHRALAVKLSLGNALALELGPAACRSGDIFRCDDPASRQQVGALLAEECRGGRHEQCFDAASRAQDGATASALLTLACEQREGRACHALAKRKLSDGARPAALVLYWKRACGDAEFELGDEAVAARNEACDLWASAVTSAGELLAVARLTQPRCDGGDSRACATTTRALDRAGASPRAFALAQRVCASSAPDAPACLDLADRYALGRGTARSVAKYIELRGEGCAPPIAWEVCKVVADYEVRHPQLGHDAAPIHAAFCAANNAEACYLGARAAEAAKAWCVGPWDDARALRATYGTLCKARFADACKREATMCALAQRELLKPRRACGGGVGDGSSQPIAEATAVIELCPKDRWSKDVRRAMTELEASQEYLEGAPR